MSESGERSSKVSLQERQKSSSRSTLQEAHAGLKMSVVSTRHNRHGRSTDLRFVGILRYAGDTDMCRRHQKKQHLITSTYNNPLQQPFSASQRMRTS